MTYKLKGYNLNIELPKSAPPFFKDLILDGSWEKYECEIIQKVISKKHRVLEGGAGLGVTSILLGRLSSFTISFEANPELAATAKKNQSRNGSPAEIVNAAIGVADNKAQFSIKPELWTSSLSTNKNSKDSITVQQVNADRIINKYGINTLVLDIEGGEEEVLSNIDLTPIEVLIVELHAHINKRGLAKKLKKAGFKKMNQREKLDHSVLWMEKKVSPWRKLTMMTRSL